MSTSLAPEKNANPTGEKYNRSISSFKTHIHQASKLKLKNSTGEAEVEHLHSGDAYISFTLNGKAQKISYPRSGFMRLVHEGKLVFLNGFNGDIVLECTITEYKDGTPVPDFPDFPDEEFDYIKRNRKKKSS